MYKGPSIIVNILLMIGIIIVNIFTLTVPDSYDAKTTENQIPLSHFAWLFYN